jgi:hypothetical protein
MAMSDVAKSPLREALSASRVSHAIDRVRVSFDEPNLVVSAGLVLVATAALRLDVEGS